MQGIGLHNCVGWLGKSEIFRRGHQDIGKGRLVILAETEAAAHRYNFFFFRETLLLKPLNQLNQVNQVIKDNLSPNQCTVDANYPCKVLLQQQHLD